MGRILLVCSLTVWVQRQALDTDAWVDTSSELLEDDEVRTALSVYISTSSMRTWTSRLCSSFFIDRRKRRRAKGAEPTDLKAEPAMPSSTAGSDEVM